MKLTSQRKGRKAKPPQNIRFAIERSSLGGSLSMEGMVGRLEWYDGIERVESRCVNDNMNGGHTRMRLLSKFATPVAFVSPEPASQKTLSICCH